MTAEGEEQGCGEAHLLSSSARKETAFGPPLNSLSDRKEITPWIPPPRTHQVGLLMIVINLIAD